MLQSNSVNVINKLITSYNKDVYIPVIELINFSSIEENKILYELIISYFNDEELILLMKNFPKKFLLNKKDFSIEKNLILETKFSALEFFLKMNNKKIKYQFFEEYFINSVDTKRKSFLNYQSFFKNIEKFVDSCNELNDFKHILNNFYIFNNSLKKSEYNKKDFIENIKNFDKSLLTNDWNNNSLFFDEFNNKLTLDFLKENLSNIDKKIAKEYLQKINQISCSMGFFSNLNILLNFLTILDSYGLIEEKEKATKNSINFYKISYDNYLFKEGLSYLSIDKINFFMNNFNGKEVKYLINVLNIEPTHDSIDYREAQVNLVKLLEISKSNFNKNNIELTKEEKIKLLNQFKKSLIKTHREKYESYIEKEIIQLNLEKVENKAQDINIKNKI